MKNILQINGLDPLDLLTKSHEIDNNSVISAVLDQARKGTVSNILKSYTGYFDVFSEPIQNALDACEKKSRAKQNYQPKIWINIDIREKIIRIIDNGCGMDLEQFCYCFTPNVSFKKGEQLRGNKGVGATYIAYGFNYVKLQTKQSRTYLSGIIQNCRSWVNDKTNNQPRPKFSESNFDATELDGEESGTCVEIRLSGMNGEKPKNLTYYGTRNANNWFEVLRIVTPLGGIYLDSDSKIKPLIEITVHDESGNTTKRDSQNCEFFYPHEIPGLKTQDLNSLLSEISKQTGDPADIKKKIKPEYKNLDCLYDIFDPEKIISMNSRGLFTEDDVILIREYKIYAYCAHMSQTKTFDKFNETLGLRANAQIMKGGLLIASDTMPQGDLYVIPLKRYIGYQRNTFVITHLRDGNPDLGRKIFQPEIKAICEKISVLLTNTMIDYRWAIKADSGSIPTLSPSNELWQWKIEQINHRSKNPFIYFDTSKNLSLVSIPREEQDVLSLYHQLLGAGVIKGIKFFGSTHHDRYDALILTNYDESHIYSQNNPMGVRDDIVNGAESEPKVLEFKKTFDSLIDDFENESKFENQIDFVVCWDIEDKYSRKYHLKSLLLDGEGNVRQFFGSTHQAFTAGNDTPIFEICILKDFLEYYRDNDKLLAQHRTAYYN